MNAKTIRYPLQTHDECDLSQKQWEFIVETLNEAAEKGKFIPE